MYTLKYNQAGVDFVYCGYESLIFGVGAHLMKREL